MGGCCGHGMDEKEMETRQILQDIVALLENARVVAVLSPEGVMLKEHWVSDEATGAQAGFMKKESKDKLIFQDLQSAAQKFGGLYDCAEIPIMHIRGQKCLISCFELRQHILVALSEPHVPHEFDTTVVDSAIRGLLDRLAAILFGPEAMNIKKARGSRTGSSARSRGTSYVSTGWGGR